MKQLHQIFCAIFALIVADHVQSIYQPHHQNQEYGNNFIDTDESPRTECPPNYSGQIAYAMDCRQFLNCWRGRGTIQSCPPGTMFNPKTKECDNPSKVKCGHYDGSSTNRDQTQTQPPALKQRFSQRYELEPIQCESGVSGLFAHPQDCTKFLNCDHGRTFIQECGPGTAFNDVFKVCDWPHKVNCGSRPLNGITDSYSNVNTNTNTNSNSYSNQNQQNGNPYANHNTNSYPNSNTNSYSNSNTNSYSNANTNSYLNPSTNSYPNSNTNSYSNQNTNSYLNTNTNSYSNSNTNSYSNQNTNSYPNQNGNSYGNSHSNSQSGTYSGTRDYYGEGAMDVRMGVDSQSSRAHSQPPPYHHQTRPYQSPHFPQNNIRNHQYPNGQHQSNDGINSLNSFSSANPVHSSPSSNTANTINPVTNSVDDQSPQESSPKTQVVQIPSQHLLPPLSSTSSNNRTGRVENNFQGQPQERVDPRLDWGQAGNSLDTSTQPTQSSVDDSFLTQQKTDTTPPQLPNFMTSRVADDFNKYFSNPQPKSTPKVPPPTTTERPITQSVTKVYSVYPSGFETIGLKCEVDRTGLHPHPYDCSRYLSCENGRILIENCEPGFMFNPMLKICDFAPNVKNCNVQSVDQGNSYTTEATKNSNDGGENRFNGEENRFGGEIPLDGLLDDTMNEIYGEDEQKKIKTATPSTGFGYSQTTAATSTIPTNPTAYFIPDMSVLPLEHGRYPQNSYPDEQNRQHGNQWPQNGEPGHPKAYPGNQNTATEKTNIMKIPTGHHGSPNQNGQNENQNRQNPIYTGFGRPSQGGDVEADTFESRNFDFNSPHDREGKGITHHETTTESQNVMKIPSGHEHVMPIYNRPTKASASTTTARANTLPQSYNHIYYQPFTKPVNETQERDETDYIPISEALKYLLRPYIARNDTKTLNSTEQMTKIEEKLHDMVDGGQTTHSRPLEQDSLASAILNENVAVKNLPESPQTELRSDVELVASTTEQFKKVEQTTSHSYIPPAAHFHPHYHNSHHHPFPPGFKHSPEFHAQHPELNKPHQYYKPGTNDPVPITFPGAHAQSHPVIGSYHHPSTPSEHGPSPSHHSNHFHNGHPHFGPNYHSNAANFGWAQNNRHTESTTPTTATVQSPQNSFANHEKPTAVSRFGKSQYGEISTCDGQFDCGTGFCISFNQLCDGRNDCGNRYDELNCPHVNYQVRLSNDKGHKHMGRVEVRAFGKWGYVCDDKFTLTNANVLCRELGFNMGAAEVKPNSFFPPNSNMPRGENMFTMDEVTCQGNETSLKECDFNGWGVSDCNADEVVGVVCKVTVMQCPPNHWLCPESEECIPMEFMCDGVKDCTDGTDESSMHCNAKTEYRLMDGNELEGRVEVKYRGVWGTVCDDDFGDKEAAVFCKSLGFTGPATVLTRRHGMSTGPIWLDQVDCLGNETALDKCMHFDWSESNCNHTEDVSVRCSHGSNSKSSGYVTPDALPQRLTNRETRDYLHEVQRSSKSVPDHSNVCGRVKVTANDDSEEGPGQFRVISGSRTKRGHHPWQATIRARGRNGRSSHWCGAVIISKNHILTAAHCLIGFPKGAYFIRLGDHHSEVREESEVEIFIENWFIHEEFRKGQLMNNDIALILLKTPIQFTNYIQPICLPDHQTIYEAGKNCTISGWGSIQYGKSTPSLDLKAASVPLISQDICRQKDIYGDEIMDTMFCAGFLDQTGVDACDGDSGGPLVCADDNGVNSLYGIISWGQRCGDSTKPGVYVKVKEYLDWIKEKMNLIN